MNVYFVKGTRSYYRDMVYASEGLNKVWKDPEFAKEYAQMTKDTPESTSGVEIEEMLSQRPKDPKVMKFYRQLIGPGPLPAIK